MKKILILLIYIMLNSCGGYEPVLYGKNSNFYIGEIININEDKITKKFIRKFKPYRDNKNKNKIDLKISSEINEKIVSKDSKGNALTFEMNIKINVIANKNNETYKFNYNESFSFNNQSNKFELKQYKKNIEDIIVDKIFEQLIINLS